MKGILKKAEFGWKITPKFHNNSLTDEIPLNPYTNFENLVENSLVEYKLEQFWETGMEMGPTEVAELLKVIDTPPYVSDDFQIGPDGAFENVETEVSYYIDYDIMRAMANAASKPNLDWDKIEKYLNTYSPYPKGTQGDIDWRNGFTRGVEWLHRQ
jgi:hypothetical protein